VIGKRIQVAWVDAQSHDAWLNLSELIEWSAKPLTVHTVGVLVHENDHCICVAGTTTDPDESCCVMQIPKRCILEMTTIRTGAKYEFDATEVNLND